MITSVLLISGLLSSRKLVTVPGSLNMRVSHLKLHWKETSLRKTWPRTRIWRLLKCSRKVSPLPEGRVYCECWQPRCAPWMNAELFLTVELCKCFLISKALYLLCLSSYFWVVISSVSWFERSSFVNFQDITK